MSKKLRAVDLFCGAGGTTSGAEMSGHVSVVLAVNHWPTAITTHRANHPHVRHVCAPIDLVDPRDFIGQGLEVVLASPECIFHSNARGGKPVDDQRRATAWCVPRWAEVLRPKWLVIENVIEFENWAPLGSDNRPLKSKKGEIFTAWVNALRALNYHVEWRRLNSADYGGATKRTRLFIVGRRGPSKQPIEWPAETHSQANWTPAAAIIDWSLPCPSIFGRKRPLADKTLRRIEIGLRKFCGPGAEPFIVKMRGTNNASSIGQPLPTVTGGPDGERRNSSPADPLPTVDTQNRHGLVAPFMVDVNHGESERSPGGRVHSLDTPMGALSTKNGKSLVLPFLTEYYGTGEARSADEPLSTVTCRHRHGLAMVQLVETMQQLGIADVGFRMLEPHELAAAQGFPKGYEIYGSKAEQVKQIGNSVHTAVARALCEAIGAAA